MRYPYEEDAREGRPCFKRILCYLFFATIFDKLTMGLDGIASDAGRGDNHSMPEYSCIHKVQYYETDQMGVVHHSNYLRWFEEARTELLEKAGLGYHEMEALGIVVPVLSISCDFKSSAKYGQTVAIIPTVEAYTGLRLEVSYRVVDAQSGELRAAGRSKHAFLDSAFRPSPLPKAHPNVDALMRRLMVES
jgi:acyl-CoA thioester hydrolase